MSGGFCFGMAEEEVALLEEELVQLSIRNNLVTPSEKSTFICSVWTKKNYNPNSFRAQMKSIWKLKKKFKIQIVGLNLFLISLESEEDLELVLEGRPWFFRRNLIIFYRLLGPIDRSQIKLVLTPFWLKLGPCLLECNKKDLMHAVCSTFGGLIRPEVRRDFCRIRIQLNVQNPLRRGLFIASGTRGKVWLLFKYENLPVFCFGCGQMGHGVVDCTWISDADREKGEDDLLYSVALRVESPLVGNEVLKLGAYMNKHLKLRQYIGGMNDVQLCAAVSGSPGLGKSKEGRVESEVLGEILEFADFVALMHDLRDKIDFAGAPIVESKVVSGEYFC